MLRYLIKRFLLVIPVFLGVSIIIFAIMHLAPGDPIVNLMGESPTSPDDYANLVAKLGLDQPLPIQYMKFLERLFQGDLGKSIMTHDYVWNEIAARFPNTLMLAFSSLILAIAVAIPVGVISAIKPNSVVDNILRGGAVFGMSMPSFWLGMVLLYIFSFQLRLTPMTGSGGLAGLLLPSLTLGLGVAGGMARLVRSTMLEVLRQDYVRTARSKGLSERVVVLKHVLGNALVPTVTSIGQRFSWLIGGSAIAETVFAYPGLGSLLVRAATQYDYPVVQGILLITTLGIVLTFIVVDILYAYIDPRIEFE